MTLNQVIAELRALNEEVPKPLRLPTPEEVDAAERRLGITFPLPYRQYLLEASDVVYGVLEPATITNPVDQTYLDGIAEGAWNQMGVPRNLIPICEDNGDYYCLTPSGEVVFWSHNGRTNERWPDLATWIKSVWIKGN